MQNRPTYSIASVDRALHLATILQQEGPLRVTDVAERLGVSESTAHRLLAMLVYRDFARQLHDRRYTVGPVLQPSAPYEAPVELLRDLALPHLRRARDEVDESVNLWARAGREMRCVATVESGRALRVGDRTGKALPLHLVSGGRAVLATMDAAEFAELYADADVDPATFVGAVEAARHRGYAVNDELTEPGVLAVGAALRTGSGSASAAVSIAMPISRSSPAVIEAAGTALLRTVGAIEADLDRRPGRDSA